MKTIAIAAAASALFVGVPTAHADQYLGLASIGDFQTWCNANAPYPTNAVAVPGPQANGAFQCFPSDRLRSGPVISVNMDAVCAQKYQNYPNAGSVYARLGAPGYPFDWGCYTR